MNELLLRRRAAMAKSLPYDAQVEYLESSGTQYIQLSGGEFLTESTRLYLKVSPTSFSGNAEYDYFGVMGNNREPQIAWYNGGWTAGNRGSAIPYVPVIGTTYNIEFSKNFDGSYWIDGYDTGLKRTGSIPQKLFWCRSNYKYSKCRLYNFKASDVNNTTLFDLIPVRVGQTGYMYDKVSGQLFGNAGTGNFILGNDVS